MSRRAKLALYQFTAALVCVFAAGLAPAAAQTTVVLSSPDGEVSDGYIRGGTYSNQVFDDGVLVTKANSNASYVRRALLKFDTQNFVPASATIQSATLTLTLRSSEADTRTLGAYRVTQSFDEDAATWYRRKTGYSWGSAGGDLGTRYAQATVTATPGTRVTFDLTRLVQETVDGTYGSRYTRVALRDLGSSSPSSYKEFYSSEGSDPANRPQLVVVYGSAATPASTSTSSLRVLHWNTHYGIGMDGVYNIDRIATWIASVDPDLVSLNEVEKNVSSHGNEDQPARYAALLTARTGRTWYYHFAQRYGDWSANGGGNLILSRFPIGATANLEMTCGDRSLGLATITVSGRNINFASTHLDSQSSSCRSTEVNQMLPWLRGFSSPRILAGDFNMSPGNSTLTPVWSDYIDAWPAASALGTAVDFAGNTRDGATHDYRIDYILSARSSSVLAVQSARVYDARDANGVRISDHKPLLVVYEVR